MSSIQIFTLPPLFLPDFWVFVWRCSILLWRFSIPIPSIEVQNYFSEAIDKYFYLNKKNIEINKIIIEAEDILKEQGEIATNYFLDLKINNK